MTPDDACEITHLCRPADAATIGQEMQTGVIGCK